MSNFLYAIIWSNPETITEEKGSQASVAINSDGSFGIAVWHGCKSCLKYAIYEDGTWGEVQSISDFKGIDPIVSLTADGSSGMIVYENDNKPHYMIFER